MTTDKKKKPSLTSQIRKLKEDLKRSDKNNDVLWDKLYGWHGTTNEINLLKKMLPISYYKISFKIKSNEGSIHPFEEIIEGCSLEHAIFILNKSHSYPNTFELIDCKVLGK